MGLDGKISTYNLLLYYLPQKKLGCTSTSQLLLMFHVKHLTSIHDTILFRPSYIFPGTNARAPS